MDGSLPDTGTTDQVDCDVLLIGGGIGSLTAAALLAQAGQQVVLLEHNHVAGGCASSFYRQGYIFESGATTLVGLDAGMPLRHVLDVTGIEIPAVALDTPMQVRLNDGTVLTRHQDLDRWIAEAERVFGGEATASGSPGAQRAFWEFCFEISQFVWDTSLKYRAFPPSSLGDLLDAIPKVRPQQLLKARHAFQTMDALLEKFGLRDNQRFVDFVNEQLLITAQNTIAEVNVLFGATALCYTNYTNYYVPGGLIELVNAFTDYIKARGSQVICRATVDSIERVSPRKSDGFRVRVGEREFRAARVISGVPIQNTLELVNDAKLRRRHRQSALPSAKLWSAFSMGLAFRGPAAARSEDDAAVLHHQLHLKTPLPHIGARSIFISLSHPEDDSRGPAGHTIVSVSTHISDPESHDRLPAEEIAQAILEAIFDSGLFRREQLVYQHFSTPRTWQQWTRRKFGFVGGHPQFRAIKPWRMLDARLGGGLYQCGDTAYPGQGIPGACLSGIVAAHKLLRDGLDSPFDSRPESARITPAEHQL